MTLLKVQTFTNKDQKLKALIYGQSGTGKTSFAGTANPKYKTLFISSENGLASVRKGQINPWTKEVHTVNPEVVVINTIEQIRELKKKSVLAKLIQGYDTIIIDSFTEISDGIKRSFKDGKKHITLQDWWVIADELKDFIIQIRDLDKHVIAICHETTKSNGDGDVLYFQPLIDWGFKDKLPHYFDIVGRIIKMPGGNRIIDVSDDGSSITKSRFSVINNNTDPNLATWIDAVIDDADKEEGEILAEATDDLYTDSLKTVGAEKNDATDNIYNYLQTNWFSDDAQGKVSSNIDSSVRFTDEEKTLYKSFVTELCNNASQQ